MIDFYGIGNSMPLLCKQTRHKFIKTDWTSSDGLSLDSSKIANPKDVQDKFKQSSALIGECCESITFFDAFFVYWP